MKPCTRVGLDLTKRCSWRCSHCFYRWAKDFNTNYDKPIDELKAEVSDAFARGCDHAVAVGWGETSLYKHMIEYLEFCNVLGMTTSIITNGCAPTSKYQTFFDAGLDHLHLSVHGLGETLDRIAGVPTASRMQGVTMKWLRDNKLPWRANMTLQQLNYKTAPTVARHCIEHDVFHFVLLGFLPHYEWCGKNLKETIVHPGELRPYLESAIEQCINAGVYCTLRYHPFCHMKPDYWRFITNARYVLFDPWEWDYDHCGEAPAELWRSALSMGDSVAIKGSPCSECAVQMHCGGWNSIYANAFDGADLKPIKECDVPRESLNKIGYFHDLNPANALKGFIRENA